MAGLICLWNSFDIECDTVAMCEWRWQRVGVLGYYFGYVSDVFCGKCVAMAVGYVVLVCIVLVD